jgi:ADP-ribosyl-[dinitrogen reductase] hydrolase
MRGCLLAGAVGDALGTPIEFNALPEIRARHGTDGLNDYAVAYGRRGAITDDTQMTLFTVGGLIRAHIRSRAKGICHSPSVLQHAYLRSLHTRGVPWRV